MNSLAGLAMGVLAFVATGSLPSAASSGNLRAPADVDESTIAVGAPIRHPEARTGAWEFRASPDRTIGLEVQLLEDVDVNAKTLANLSGTIRFIRVNTYLRVAGHTTRTYWLSSQSNGTFEWKHDRLQIHQTASPGSGFFPIDLDVRFDATRSRWDGSFHDPNFSGDVVLVRPARREARSPVGEWGDDGECVHIAMGDDGRLVAWDDITFFTYPTPGPNVSQPLRPSGRQQSYAEFDDDPMEQRSGEVWTFRIGNGLGGNTYTGELSDDGSSFSGTYVHDGNGTHPIDNPHPVYPFTFHRGRGASCSMSKASSKRETTQRFRQIPSARASADLDETTISVGAPVLRPQVRTGAWEFHASPNRTIGLEIQIIEDVASNTRSLVNLIGTIRSVEVETYARVDGRTTRAFWWRSDQSTASFQWRHDRLRIHQIASAGFLPVDLDLRFDPRLDRWIGSFHDPSFLGRVVLLRPNQREAGSPVGAWGVDGNCAHIAMGSDGRLIAWSDYTFFTYPTPPPNAPQPQQPSGRQQSYGEFEGDPMEQRSGAVWTFRIGSLLGGDTYTGSLNADGSTFSGTFVHDGNGFYSSGNPHPVYPFTLRRGNGVSCSNAQVEG